MRPFLSVLLFLATAPQLTGLVLATATDSAQATEIQDKLAEYEQKRKKAGKDVEKLWELHLWCDAHGMDKQSRSCLRAVVKADKQHREAHEALGHMEFAGKWFTSKKKLEKFKAAEELRIAKEKGLVRHEGEWVSKADIPFLERGLVRDDSGEWVSKQDLERLANGWTKQDLVWVSPEETDNIGKGLWKCGDAWKSLEEANEFHSRVGNWWVIPTDWFTLYTTLDREVAMQAIDHMERGYRDVQRATGAVPSGPVNVAMFRSEAQYVGFAAGSDTRMAVETRGLSTIHWSYFADNWIEGGNQEFLGCGVGFWDASTEAGGSYGVHAARHAAALSLLDALDPSTKAVAVGRKANFEKWKGSTFWNEKKMPEWFRFGLSSYTGRFFIDQFSSSDKYTWARKWSIENLIAKGGLSPLAQVFDGKLNVDHLESSIRLINEFGLVMAFALDGENAKVDAAFEAVRVAIKAGAGEAKAYKDLRSAIEANDAALREFAGL